MKNLKTYKINLSNIKLVTNKHLCLSLLPSGIPLLAAQKSRYPILQNQAVFIFLQNVFSLFFGENVGRKKVVFLKSKAILYFIRFEYALFIQMREGDKDSRWHLLLLGFQYCYSLVGAYYPSIVKTAMECKSLLWMI